ncbi:MAG: DUF4342 domain-containing protein [Acidobacteria bacterium]|nr:DUF4342 domain-containing protein [Acidobacteriota bacterium]
MEEKTFWQTIKAGSGELVEAVRKVVHEGNVRRVIVRQGDRTVAEFPLTVGVVGTVFAPVLAAIGALTALLTDCSILVERVQTAEPKREEPAEPQEPPPAPQN